MPDQKVRLHFRELPAVEMIKYRDAIDSGDDEKRAAAAVRLVAASLCEPDGSPAMTWERALELRAGPLNALFSAVLEVNAQPVKKSGSAAKPGSGTS